MSCLCGCRNGLRSIGRQRTSHQPELPSRLNEEDTREMPALKLLRGTHGGTFVSLYVWAPCSIKVTYYGCSVRSRFTSAAHTARSFGASIGYEHGNAPACCGRLMLRARPDAPTAVTILYASATVYEVIVLHTVSVPSTRRPPGSATATGTGCECYILSVVACC